MNNFTLESIMKLYKGSNFSWKSFYCARPMKKQTHDYMEQVKTTINNIVDLPYPETIEVFKRHARG